MIALFSCIVRPVQQSIKPSTTEKQMQGYLYVQVICSSLCLSLLDDSGWSADTYSDTEQHDCPQAAAFLMHSSFYLCLDILH